MYEVYVLLAKCAWKWKSDLFSSFSFLFDSCQRWNFPTVTIQFYCPERRHTSSIFAWFSNFIWRFMTFGAIQRKIYSVFKWTRWLYSLEDVCAHCHFIQPRSLSEFFHSSPSTGASVSFCTLLKLMKQLKPVPSSALQTILFSVKLIVARCVRNDLACINR